MPENYLMNPFLNYVNYVTDDNNISDWTKFLKGRVMSGTAFGQEAHITVQYCCGGSFATGYIGNMLFRIYSNPEDGLHGYFCGIDDQINETRDADFVSTQGYRFNATTNVAWGVPFYLKEEFLKQVEEQIKLFNSVEK